MLKEKVFGIKLKLIKKNLFTTELGRKCADMILGHGTLLFILLCAVMWCL